jgi:RecJ-like exonuclease
MNLKRMILVTTLIVSTVMLWTLQVGAYGLITGDPPESNLCSQCHTFPGGNHDFHINAGIGCAACHGDFSAPVVTSACSACHGAGTILDAHSGIEAPNGEYCGYCHEGVTNESHSFTELKNIFE